MQIEQNRIPDQLPDWAARERARDLAWIHSNLELFWETAVQADRIIGRGAIIVDVAAKPMDTGNLFTYFSEDEIQRYEDEDINRLLADYTPGAEFVVVLLKPESRTSAYRIRPLPADSNDHDLT